MITTIVDNILDSKYIEILDKLEINHLKNVFRVKKNDKIRAIDFKKEYFCKILEIDKKRILLEILEEKDDTYSLDINIDFSLAIIKNDKLKLSIQKLTEIGISKVYITKMDRSIVKLEEKKDKWDLIVKESLKQCQGIKKMQLELINGIERINYDLYDKIIYAYECSNDKKSLKDIINPEKDKNILCIIGPEGGLSENEIAFLKKINAIEISLGKRILRAETAAIITAGIISNLI